MSAYLLCVKTEYCGTEVSMVWLFLFPETDRYNNTLLKCLKILWLCIVDIAEVYCKITRGGGGKGRRKSIKYCAHVHCS
jgi:hypothetical protein